MISFFASGIPKGQPRPRAFARKMGNKFVARVYDAGTAEAWKSAVAMAAKDFLPDAPLEGPLRVCVVFYFPRPKYHFNKAGIKADAPILHTQKPDADNAVKAVFDALTTLGMWKDDAQVSSLDCRKFFSNDGKPGAYISIATHK